MDSRFLRQLHDFTKTTNHLVYFGIISAILAIIALAFFIPVFVSFIDTGLVEKVPTLIVCGFAASGFYLIILHRSYAYNYDTEESSGL